MLSRMTVFVFAFYFYVVRNMGIPERLSWVTASGKGLLSGNSEKVIIRT